VFRADSEGAKQVDQLQHRVREGVSKLKGLDMGDELSVEILGQLVQGRKTTTEITESIYGLSYSDEGWKSSYSKVNRQIRRLESKGLVSRRLLGKDKPYRLTRLAVTSCYLAAQEAWGDGRYGETKRVKNILDLIPEPTLLPILGLILLPTLLRRRR
jgi:hypothetical protein